MGNIGKFGQLTSAAATVSRCEVNTPDSVKRNEIQFTSHGGNVTSNSHHNQWTLHNRGQVETHSTFQLEIGPAIPYCTRWLVGRTFTQCTQNQTRLKQECWNTWSWTLIRLGRRSNILPCLCGPHFKKQVPTKWIDVHVEGQHNPAGHEAHGLGVLVFLMQWQPHLHSCSPTAQPQGFRQVWLPLILVITQPHVLYWWCHYDRCTEW